MDIEQYAEFAPQYYGIDLPPLLERYLKTQQYKSLLDCGCGDGSLLHALYKRNYLLGKEVGALDLSAYRIELVKKINQEIIARVDSAETMATVPNSSIDFFISTQVIEHVDQEKMLDSIARILKVNGTAYVSTVFKKWYGWYFYRNAAGKWVMDPTHVREYTKDGQLLNAIRRRNLMVAENKKTLLMFPVIDLIFRVLKIRNRRLFENRFLSLLRRFALPIPGYYNWEIVMKKD
jgi:2-polyprenyl-3-methyl-5-hydroxy-6-metoxy-1,4-benzoquinol methylase